jgi:hypothetical protein
LVWHHLLMEEALEVGLVVGLEVGLVVGSEVAQQLV